MKTYRHKKLWWIASPYINNDDEICAYEIKNPDHTDLYSVYNFVINSGRLNLLNLSTDEEELISKKELKYEKNTNSRV